VKELLKGQKVVEFASVLAGPAVGMFLAELGADVVKIENALTKGDSTRHWKLPGETTGGNTSAYFAAVNYGKEHLFLNLKDPVDLSKAQSLAAKADIVISNFKAGASRKLGVDYETLKQLNPRLIYAELTGFDSTPNRVAYDVVIQAECGFMGMNGTPDSGPVKLPLAFIDIFAAHHLKEGILAALYERTKTGVGRKVHCSLETCALANLGNQASNYLTAGHVAQRIGSLHPNIAPYGETFTCEDGKNIVLAIGTNKQFQKLTAILDVAELATDDRYASNPERVLNRVALQEYFTPLFAKSSRDEILQKLIEADVPCAAVKMMDEVLETSNAQSLVLEDEHDGQTLRRISSVGFKLSD
jgi:crotonobetainyl-CoA:carnitine CoA-transferase CaiB-like acyl-CoA transferase